MADIMDYLDWRGDVPFSLSPVNEVDEFILCKIGTPDLRGIAPEDGTYIPIGRAVDAYHAAGGEMRLGAISSRFTVPVFTRLRSTARFGDVMLSGFRDSMDQERTEQFAALTVRLPGGQHYVTFRGTDDTIVGWEENFLLAVRDATSAQKSALAYLRWAAETYPGDLVLAGHSKGGNLAVYAAACAPEEIQNRIIRICNSDGPGFQESFLATPGYQRIKGKIRSLLPRNATVGTLLYQDAERIIVDSGGLNHVSAHDGFKWKTSAAGFIRCGELSPSSRTFDKGMKEILGRMTMEQREAFIEEFFGTLRAGGARTLTDVSEQRLRQTLQMVRSLNQEPEVHRMALNLLETMTRGYVAERGASLPRLRMPKRFRRKTKAPDETEEK